jgi:hypothetical protein
MLKYLPPANFASPYEQEIIKIEKEYMHKKAQGAEAEVVSALKNSLGQLKSELLARREKV